MREKLGIGYINRQGKIIQFSESGNDFCTVHDSPSSEPFKDGLVSYRYMGGYLYLRFYAKPSKKQILVVENWDYRMIYETFSNKTGRADDIESWYDGEKDVNTPVEVVNAIKKIYRMK